MTLWLGKICHYTGKWERDEMKEAAMRSVEFKDWKDNVTFTDMHLENFEKKMAYDVEMYAMHNVMYSTVYKRIPLL